jgi:hypothetical protein
MPARTRRRCPVLVEQYVVVGDKSDAETAAELWRVGPEAFKGYYNVSDPTRIQQRAEAEIALDKVMNGWPTIPGSVTVSHRISPLP